MDRRDGARGSSKFEASSVRLDLFPLGAGPALFAVGCANWTFFGSDRGGQTAAVSFEMVRVDPFASFRDVLSRVADHPITKLDELLPHRWAAIPS